MQFMLCIALISNFVRVLGSFRIFHKKCYSCILNTFVSYKLSYSLLQLSWNIFGTKFLCTLHKILIKPFMLTNIENGIFCATYQFFQAALKLFFSLFRNYHSRMKFATLRCQNIEDPKMMQLFYERFSD